MTYIAIIENGIVTNVTGCDCEKTASEMYDNYVVITGVYPAIGWLYNGETFINPEVTDEETI